METKSVENRIYLIVIVSLLIFIGLISWEKSHVGRYQLSGNYFLNTGTGEVYVLELITGSDGKAYMWGYIGKLRKDIDYEEITTKLMKNIGQKGVK